MNTMIIITSVIALNGIPAPSTTQTDPFVASLQRVMMLEAAPLANVNGTIISVSKDAKSFMLRESDDKIVTIKIDDKTVFTLDGKKSTRKDALAISRQAKITQKGDAPATRVDVTTKK